VLFPVSGVEVSALVPPLVAFAVSFVTSMGGVSGAFLLLPFQMSVLGFTTPAVSATNQVYNIVAIPGGVLRFIREGRMVWPLTLIVVAGTLPGVLVGALVRVRYLPDPARFKLFAGAVLLYVGGRLAFDLIRARGGEAASAEEQFHRLVSAGGTGDGADAGRLARVTAARLGLRRTAFEFYGQRFEIPTLGVLLLSLAVGAVAGVYGIGGGAILAPFFVAFFGLPVYTVAGAALAGTFVTSIAGVGFYHAIAPFYPHLAVAPDWPLGLLFGLGGMVGIYLGARCQKHVPAKGIKWMLVVVIVAVAASYLRPLLG